MAILHINRNGPSSNSSGNVGLSIITPTKGNLLVLQIYGAAGQSLPASLSGWTTTRRTNGTNFVAGTYWRISDGSETIAPAITSTAPTLVWVNEYKSDRTSHQITVLQVLCGIDDDSTNPGLATNPADIYTSQVNDVLDIGFAWTATSPSNPTLPTNSANPTIKLGGVDFAALTWGPNWQWETNYRYFIPYVTVNTATSGLLTASNNLSDPALVGIAQFAVLREMYVATANAGQNQTALSGTTVTLNGSGGDTYAWRQVSGQSVTLSSTTVANPTFTAPQVTIYTPLVFGLVITSNSQTSQEATVTVMVAPFLSNATISFVHAHGPTATTSGNLSLDWTTQPSAGNTLLLNVVGRTGQTLPANIRGWKTIFTNGVSNDFVSAQYLRIADGTEGSGLNITNATQPCMAWVKELRSSEIGSSVLAVEGFAAADNDITANGFTPATRQTNSVAGCWIDALSVWSSASPSFPSLPIATSDVTLTQSGATLTTVNTRSNWVALTNYRYMSLDTSVNVGSTGNTMMSTNAGSSPASDLRGITNFAVLATGPTYAKPTASAIVPSTAAKSGTVTATDNSTSTNATTVFRTWRIISGGGSLSSQDSSPITITLPNMDTIVTLGLVVYDSNGMKSTEATYRITVGVGLTANAGNNQTVDALSQVTLTGTGSSTQWSWRQISGTTVTLSSTNTASVIFDAPATVNGETLIFGLTGSDGTSTSAEATVSIIVKPQTEWIVKNGSWRAVKINHV